MYFDSHAHYDDARFEEDREEVLRSLPGQGVDGVIDVGADMVSSLAAIRLAERYDFVYAAVGVHPHETEGMTAEDLARLSELLDHEKVVALGEIGLDYHYDNSPRELQRLWFDRQLALAEQKDVPVIIHDREAHGDTMELLKRHHNRGVLHCFSGSAEMACELLKMDFYLAFGGSCTFKNAKTLPQVIAAVPPDRFLIETDCPYLAPVPHRGERNHSGFLCHIVEKIAEFRGTTAEEIARLSSENARRLFGI